VVIGCLKLLSPFLLAEQDLGGCLEVLQSMKEKREEEVFSAIESIQFDRDFFWQCVHQVGLIL